MVVPGQLVQHRQVERERLPRRGAAGDDDVSLAGGVQRLELVGVEGRDAAAEERGVQLGGDPAGYRDGFRRRSRLEALGDQAPVGPPRLDRAGPARLGGGASGPSAIAAATRMASSAERSWSLHYLGAGRDRESCRGRGRPLALGRRRPVLPRARQQSAQEVLARKGHEEGTPEAAQLADAGQDLHVVPHREVEVEPGVQGDLLLGDPAGERALQALGEPPDQVRDRIVVLRGLTL